jgi:hypothetical protein
MSPFLSENLRKRSRKIRPGAPLPDPARRSANVSLIRIRFPSGVRTDLLFRRTGANCLLENEIVMPGRFIRNPEFRTINGKFRTESQGAVRV